MVITNVMISTGLIIISFFISFVVFYIYSDLSRTNKMKLIQETISQLINLVFFVWVAKIIFNFSLFIKAPLTILAYPSNSYVFYTAVVINSMIFIYKNRKKRDTAEFIEAFTIILLTASVIYELVKFIWGNSTSSFGYLLLLSFILLVFLLLQERLKPKILFTISSLIWVLGMLILLKVYPVITIFGYIVRPWFLPIFFVLSTSLLFLTIREGDK